MPSIIWMTKPAKYILRSMGLKPEQYLEKIYRLDRKAESIRRLKISYFYTLRSVVCGFFALE